MQMFEPKITIEQLYELFLAAGSVTTDSRNFQPRALFFALKGERFDGNQFALQVLKEGCSYAVVDDPEIARLDKHCLWVENVLQTLSDLARYHRRALGLPLLAITGTNGKTTTKELVATVLRQHYNVGATEGNLNNHIGVPLTLLRLQRAHQIAVVEMGASHRGDIKQLTDIAEPDYALITNIGRAHLEGFGSYEGVVQTKSELYDYVRAHGGKVFLHSDDAILPKAADGIPSVTYGTDVEAQVRGNLMPHLGGYFLAFRLFYEDLTYDVHTHLVGDYNLPNALSAVAAGLTFGIPIEDIVKALEAYRPTNNRSQFIPSTTRDNELIVDAYNANPTSMRIAVDNFASLASSRPKVMILGDMYELGSASEEEHRNIAEYVSQLSGVETIYLVGRAFYALHKEIKAPHLYYFSSRDELLKTLSSTPFHGQLILLKASNSMRFSSLVELC
ncbi:UDP-N-acetylmuramoyl-tripeptide--D-alanyl-D-alanine ligase [Porphyromonas circumdentaria]|uniref:UDP-N-acetylmuramoyl-tripeptide--D-alanyl-D-alanine ligase n=1 Tax=Porphyromonas circumdentaria TaxID=29524 RepID=A0A1T4PMH1_9PORP|nr:UDP-N-acetylmuramoyl-tripeptide--D-alanyl-D-alanine ligase [Porphyromonas circumdentaria]